MQWMSAENKVEKDIPFTPCLWMKYGIYNLNMYISASAAQQGLRDFVPSIHLARWARAGYLAVSIGQ